MPEHPRQRRRETGNDAPHSIGERIRQIRKAASLTLQELSTASGISRAALSKIERGEGSPTYDSLLKLARGLRTEVATLVAGRTPPAGRVEVTRAGEGARYKERQFTHHLLAHRLPQRSLHAFVTEVPAIRLEDYGPWDTHESEDFLYVLEGTVAVHLEGREPVELREGDSMQMDCRIAHALVAVPGKGERAEKPARLLWVSVPLG